MTKNQLIKKVVNTTLRNYKSSGHHDGEPGHIIEKILTGKVVGSSSKHDIEIDKVPHEIKVFTQSFKKINISEKVIGLDSKEDIKEWAYDKMRHLLLIRYTKKDGKYFYKEFYILGGLDEKKFKDNLYIRKNESQFSSVKKLWSCYKNKEEIK